MGISTRNEFWSRSRLKDNKGALPCFARGRKGGISADHTLSRCVVRGISLVHVQFQWR